MKTEIVLPWETPAGTDYGTEPLTYGAIADLLGWTEEERAEKFVSRSGYLNGGNVRQKVFLSDFIKDNGITKTGTYHVNQRYDDKSRLIYEEVYGFNYIDGDDGSDIVAAQYGILDGYMAMHTYTYYDEDKPAINTSSNNTSGVNVADDWIDVYYYYTLPLDHDVEVKDEE